jgi:hypothetical protein
VQRIKNGNSSEKFKQHNLFDHQDEIIIMKHTQQLYREFNCCEKNKLKYYFTFALSLAFFTITIAQTKPLMVDKEKLFTDEAASRIDSMLQSYFLHSHNLMVVYTDSINIDAGGYQETMISEFIKDTINAPYALFLYLSKKNGQINLVSNSRLKEYANLNQLMPILGAGIPSLKEKKTEEGVVLICKKAMEFLNGLPF